MKNFLSIILIATNFSLLAQTRPESVERKNYKCWWVIDGMINSYTDSLNFPLGETLPNFLFDPRFDLSSSRIVSECFRDPHQISFRFAIMQRTLNVRSLELIVLSKDLRLDSLYNPSYLRRVAKNYPTVHGATYPDLPYMGLSTRELARRRLEELKRKMEGRR
jgi:hypothetical protein